MMNTKVKFYTATESFKQIKEHVCVCVGEKIVALTGDNMEEINFGTDEDKKEVLQNFIETIAMSVIMSLSFDTFKALRNDTIFNVEKESVNRIIDTLSRTNLSYEIQESLLIHIKEKVRELTS